MFIFTIPFKLNLVTLRVHAVLYVFLSQVLANESVDIETNGNDLSMCYFVFQPAVYKIVDVLLEKNSLDFLAFILPNYQNMGCILNLGRVIKHFCSKLYVVF
jgi:hypothetical protein